MLTEAETKFARADITVDSDGVFSGYASLFDEADLGHDIVQPGAFRATLAKRGSGGIKMLWQHDPQQQIGTWNVVREDSRGLWVCGQLDLDNGRAIEVLSLMLAGTVDGLSIGYRTVRARTEARTGYRRLLELDLWEVSVVAFPMLPGARITPAGLAALREDGDE